MAPGPAELLDAVALTVTLPVAPATQVAKPVCVMVATFGFETNQLPEYGATKGTVSGVGIRLKVPVAVNCTCRIGDLEASPVAGLMDIESNTRFPIGVVPHPLRTTERPAAKIRPVVHVLKEIMLTSATSSLKTQARRQGHGEN